jgi:hypothetical protein
MSFNSIAGWIEAGVSDDEHLTVFANRETIRKQGSKVKMWSLSNLKNPQLLGGKPYLSSKEQVEYDCGEERARSLATSFHSDHMGEGSLVYSDSVPGKWEPVFPDSLGEALYSVACIEKTPGEGWTVIDSNTVSIIYVNPTTIIKERGKSRMWSMWDFRKPQRAGKSSILSSKSETEYDCYNKRSRLLGSTLYSGNFGAGTAVLFTKDDKWEPMPDADDDDIAAAQWKIACAP